MRFLRHGVNYGPSTGRAMNLWEGIQGLKWSRLLNPNASFTIEEYQRLLRRMKG